MGRYFNPPREDAIEAAGGRRLERVADHSTLSSQLQEGEHLGMHLDRYMFKQMPDVTDPLEFKEFQSQVNEGVVRFLGFYAVPKEHFR